MAASSLKKFFYNGFRIKGVVLKSIKYIGETIIFGVVLKRSLKKCPHCHSPDVQIKETIVRRLRMVPLGNKKCFLEVVTHKLKCKKCGSSAWIRLPFSRGKLPMTNAFIEYVLQMAKLMTLQSVSLYTGIQWKTAKNLHKDFLRKKYKRFGYRNLIYLSMDEFSIKKGHKYMTIFLDLRTGRILYAVVGRRIEDIAPFLMKLRKRAPNLKAIAMDLSPTFISAVKEHLPRVAIVFDHFHVTKILNQALDEVRKCEHEKHSPLEKVGKGNRFLFFKNFENLDQAAAKKLNHLCEINKNLALAYELKEQFRIFWIRGSMKEGKKFLFHWIDMAKRSGIKPLEKVARTFLRHQEGLLNYFNHPISNGKIEGINNKIKVQKRCGYGYRDTEYFTYLLYDLHTKDFKLVG